MTRPGLLMVALAVLAVPGACTRRPAGTAGGTPAYTVGPAYQAGGVWFYPREQFQYVATGLAAVSDRRDGRTANGEAVEPESMTAAHPTLQLPSVARVTNLGNGRSALVRVNDRGPMSAPGRVIELGPRAAAVLDAGPDARVRVELDGSMSRAVADGVGGAPPLAMTAAPAGTVTAETLAPPPGVGQSARVRGASVPGPVAAAPTVAAPLPDRLPASYTQGPAEPGALYVRASEFGRLSYAEDERRKLAGLPVTVERVREPRQERFRVRAGPFATVAAADQALRRARDAGVVDARIVVE